MSTIKKKRLRILHAPSGTGGQAWSLSRAERKLGFASDHMVFNRSKFGYPADIDLAISDKPRFVALFLKLAFFIRALIRYKVFHFYSAKSLLPFYIDLPILNIFNKIVVMTFQGTDIRRGSATLSINNNIETFGRPYHTGVPDKIISNRVKKITKYTHLTYVLNPDLIASSPGSVFLPYANVNVHAIEPVYPRGSDQLLIIHAPSKRSTKGTEYILAAIERLQKESLSFTFQLLEDLSHQELQVLSRKADIIIDQLTIGWYGGFSVEMMALGKPVVCYIDTRVRPLVPFFDEIPLINANKDSLETVLRSLINNPTRLTDIGIKSRAFALQQHDPLIIAQQTVSDYSQLINSRQ